MLNETEAGGDALDEQLAEVARLTDSGEEEEALSLLLELEREHPDHAALLCMTGALAANLGAEGMAVDFFRRTLEQNPTDPRLLVAAGAGLAAAGDPEAEPALRLAALSAPDLAPARMHYGAYLARSGMIDQALNELHTARDLDPDDADARRELGIAYLLASRGAEALSELESAVAAAPEEADTLLLFSLALIQEGDLSRAAEEAYPIAEAVADDAETQLLLALLFRAEGWEDEAWLALSRAEAAPAPADAAVVREVEEALESGEAAVRALLLDEVAPSLLRDRTLRF